MSSTTSPASTHSEVSSNSTLEALDQFIYRIAELLPSQGPITAFVFLNTLQALETMSFQEGVRKGAQLFGCQPYLTEDRYRTLLERGRIRQIDLETVLRDELSERADVPVALNSTRYEIHRAMLFYPIHTGPAEELRWLVAEADSLRHFREETPPIVRDRMVQDTRRWVMRDLHADHQMAGHSGSHQGPTAEVVLGELLQESGEESIEHWSSDKWEMFSLQALWRVCRHGVHTVPTLPKAESKVARHRNLVLNATGEDSDALVNKVLIRFSAAFTDQGFAAWMLPNRNLGYYHAFLELYGSQGGPPDRWMAGLAKELRRLKQTEVTALQSLQESLDLLGIGSAERDDYLTAILLSLKGWAGLLWQMEVRDDRVPKPVPKNTLVEYLAVRLILERCALTYLGKTVLNYHGPLSGLREAVRGVTPPHTPNGYVERAFLLYQVAQLLGWSAPDLSRLSHEAWIRLVNEVEGFTELDRREMFHLAFERRFRNRALDAISLHCRRTIAPIAAPRFQVSFCIDTREESFRRNIEELVPDAETFGVAGFYGVPIYYRGIADAHFSTLCPIVLRPKHWLTEEAIYSLEEENRRLAKTRKNLGTASHQVHLGSRSAAGGALLTASLGVLASIPLVARVLFPRWTAQLRKTAGQLVAPPKITRLRLERTAAEPGSEDEQIGFTLEEMANFGERTLRDMGLTKNFARIVIFLGHGSYCLNNPHKSAYDCGACSGGTGGPNARVYAMMLNHPQVRGILASRGLVISSETVFIGGQHNTCNDTIEYYDLDLLPKSHLKDFESTRQTLEEVCRRNAHERCRRFDSAPLTMSFEEAHGHVDGRSQDLAQPRPEFGNCTNAMCVVGRRARTRGLYLDRRSFLVSYDPTQDDEEATILGRILGAVVPVCEGINLQYYFSYVDSPGWGSGTKLPHNITSLLGVMEGAESDLRSGLPWQGVEIHEPVRLLFVIESTPEAILKIMGRNELVRRILMNGWVQLSLLNPYSSEVLHYRNGEFVSYVPEVEELPQAESSHDWYRGWRDHLEFAEITSRTNSVSLS